MVEAILTAVIPVVIIGVICGAGLVIVSKVMSVKENELLPKIRECLPGANCGACGFAGCDGYAKALCENPDTPANLCVPGADTVSEQLSALLGVEKAEVEKKIAVVHCSGDCAHTQDKVEYRGIESCKAAKLLYGGKGKCTYGCLGFGDCMNACPQNAICISEGVARINPNLCIGCGICTRTCPNRLISLIPDRDTAIVGCSNRDKGAAVRQACSSGCIGCKKCERVCPQNAVKVNDNIAVIDYNKCEDCPDFGICVRSCTTGCLVLLRHDEKVKIEN